MWHINIAFQIGYHRWSCSKWSQQILDSDQWSTNKNDLKIMKPYFTAGDNVFCWWVHHHHIRACVCCGTMQCSHQTWSQLVWTSIPAFPACLNWECSMALAVHSPICQKNFTKKNIMWKHKFVKSELAHPLPHSMCCRCSWFLMIIRL